MLRATYVDPTGKTVATVVLIVLPEGESKKKELEEFFLAQDGQAGTVNPLPVPGTFAAGFKPDRRNGAGSPRRAVKLFPTSSRRPRGRLTGESREACRTRLTST